MSDPQITQTQIDFLVTFAKDTVEKHGIKNIDLVGYYNYLMKESSRLKWTELEYCVKYPLHLLGNNLVATLTFRFPTVGEAVQYQRFLDELPPEKKMQFVKKIQSIPLSVSSPSLTKVGTEILTDLTKWKYVAESLSVISLPTDTCNEMINKLKEFSSSEMQINYTGMVTLTESLIRNKTECKDEIWEMFKQNSRKNTSSTNSLSQFPNSKSFRSEYQFDRSETVERSSESLNSSRHNPPKQNIDMMNDSKLMNRQMDYSRNMDRSIPKLSGDYRRGDMGKEMDMNDYYDSRPRNDMGMMNPRGFERRFDGYYDNFRDWPQRQYGRPMMDDNRDYQQRRNYPDEMPANLKMYDDYEAIDDDKDIIDCMAGQPTINMLF